MDWEKFAEHLFLSVFYAALGLALLGLGFWIITRVTPFSVRKEIEKDQNTALAIIIGAIILGVSIIIASAIH
jgi:uncharacterized membrane protein YjfL (UPF0719 family)